MRELSLNCSRNRRQRAAPGTFTLTHQNLASPRANSMPLTPCRPLPSSYVNYPHTPQINAHRPPPSQLMFICPLTKVLALARMCKLRTRSLRTWTVTMAGLALLEGSQIFTFGRESRNHIIWEPITQGIATGMPSQLREKKVLFDMHTRAGKTDSTTTNALCPRPRIYGNLDHAM